MPSPDPKEAPRAPAPRPAPAPADRLGRSFVASLALHGLLASAAFALPFAVLRGKAPERTASLVEVRVAPRPVLPELLPEAAEPEHQVHSEPLPDPVFRPLDIPEEPWPERPPLEDIEMVPAEFERLPLDRLERREVLEAPAEPEPEPEPAELAAASPEEPGVETVVSAPVLIPALSPRPPYPRQAQRLGWQGDVVCRITVGVDGRVLRATVVRSSGRELLDDAAQEGVLAWRFQPALVDGEPVQRDVLMRVAFQMDA